MVILDEKTEVKWNYRTREHYEMLGYKFTGYRSAFVVKIEDLPKTAHKKIRIKCDYCEQVYISKYATVMAGRETGVKKDACSNCRHLKQSEIKFGKLLTVGNTPELLKYFSIRNTENPNRLTLHSSKKVWWFCDEGHEYQTTVSKKNKHDCPYCKNRKVLKGFNDLATIYPDILNYWSKNNNFSPSEIVFGSHKRIELFCNSCTGKWKTKAFNAVKENGKVFCPYCNNAKVLPQFNDFATYYPELVDEWFCEKYKPNELLFNSATKVKWKCRDCNFTFKRSPHERNTDFCPYCSGSELKTGFNDITVTNKLGLKDWSHKNTINPRKETRFSQKIAIWKCYICKYEWKEEIRNKLKRKICPSCTSSAGERQVQKILQDMKIKFEKEYSINTLKGIGDRNLRFDFAILNKKEELLGFIEFDGEQHFKAVDYFGGEKKLNIIQKHDKIKNEYCSTKNIPLLRVNNTFDEEELLETIQWFISKLVYKEGEDSYE